ncbi:nitroreductase family protein [Sphingobacterium sp. LRF_L2]|uniref:nitroreductase family protein n=1 Tax=Sphingobacterium sp. LRF_L2 TaxID=3369421 RepID=UPI003F606EFB
MFNNKNKASTAADTKISRQKFLGSLGALGALPFLATACSPTSEKPQLYEGENKEAIIDNILNRRSIRKYTEQEVDQEILDRVMRCAIFAPSAVNAQPWEVRVIKNKKVLTEINERWRQSPPSTELANARNPEFSTYHHAPVLIVIAGDSNNVKSRVDVGIMLQTILLSAHALGLGTCPIGRLVPTLTRPENKDILDILNIPEGYEVMANVALGYPDENPTAPIRYSDKVKYIR